MEPIRCVACGEFMRAYVVNKSVFLCCPNRECLSKQPNYQVIVEKPQKEEPDDRN